MNHKVIVVDEDPKTVRLVESNLIRDGYTVIAADNGADAVAKVIAEQPWLVVMGEMLPDMSGAKMLEMLGITPATEGGKMVVIMLLRRVMGEGDGLSYYVPFRGAPGAYIKKPFNPMELMSYIRRFRKQMEPADGGGAD